mgnify:FL=1
MHTTDGQPIGTLCALDTKPRHFDAEQQQLLRDLANMVEAELRSHEIGGLQHEIMVRRQAEADAAEQEQRIRSLHAVAAGTGSSTDEQLQETLTLGCRILGMEVGVISCVDGDTCRALATYDPGQLIPADHAFDLRDTFCDEMTTVSAPVVMAAAATSIESTTHK